MNIPVVESCDVYKVNSLILSESSSPIEGHVEWDAARSLWNGGSLVGALVLGPMYFNIGALTIFVYLLVITMCAGHSVGFHRRLIHRTFKCPKRTERVLVWLGVLVGMQGPLWVVRSHDLRDWAQRQPNCHPYLRHGHGLWRDGWWNLHCRLVLDNPPAFDPGPGIADDGFYRFLQRTWMAQQIPIAIVFFLIGGMPWLVWGVIVRVAVGVHSHWYVGYLCHTTGPQDWVVDAGAIQAHNVPWAAIPSMGECWHNNHHAFPASAKHGLYPGQIDLGFHCVEFLERLGLAWDIQVADELPVRPGITPMTPQAMQTMAIQRKRQRETQSGTSNAFRPSSGMRISDTGKHR